MKDRVSIDELKHDLETGMTPEDEQIQKQLEKDCREEVVASTDRGEMIREIIKDLCDGGRVSDRTWNELFDHFLLPRYLSDGGIISKVGIWVTVLCKENFDKRIQEETESRVNRAMEARKEDYQE